MLRIRIEDCNFLGPLGPSQNPDMDMQFTIRIPIRNNPEKEVFFVLKCSFIIKFQRLSVSKVRIKKILYIF